MQVLLAGHALRKTCPSLPEEHSVLELDDTPRCPAVNGPTRLTASTISPSHPPPPLLRLALYLTDRAEERGVIFSGPSSSALTPPPPTLVLSWTTCVVGTSVLTQEQQERAGQASSGLNEALLACSCALEDHAGPRKRYIFSPPSS
ncbi:unnamed protein product [Rangifer tarandus platyrhynchus]|uniref:Uncharacterized protein n=1 Tax=Rangifer tarandus platyrhynchus TaxID=3082113 RepID=A0AC59YR07_RANTA